MNTPDEVRGIAETLAASTDTSQKNLSTLLLGGAAINLAIIAEAIPKLLAAHPDPKAPLTLRDLSPAERDMIEALRRGDINVVEPDHGRVNLTPS